MNNNLDNKHKQQDKEDSSIENAPKKRSFNGENEDDKDDSNASEVTYESEDMGKDTDKRTSRKSPTRRM
ncbi:hypothetical protein MTO96_022900 [Rhipicephalus appendiculatus]